MQRLKQMNTEITKEAFLKSILFLLGETFEGSPDGHGSIYLDGGVGVIGTLGQISAAQASRSINQMTIAAQTEHAKFYLDRLCEFMRGRTEKVNWEQSWLIETVNDDEWNALRAGVQKSYEATLKCFAETEEWDEDKIVDALAIVAHTAYHFGAIRQLKKSLN